MKSYSIHSILSYDVAIMQGIPSCHNKSYGHTCNNTLTRTRIVTDNAPLKNVFSECNEIMFSLQAIKSHILGSYYKQTLIPMVISIILAENLFHKFQMK